MLFLDDETEHGTAHKRSWRDAGLPERYQPFPDLSATNAMREDSLRCSITCGYLEAYQLAVVDDAARILKPDKCLLVDKLGVETLADRDAAVSRARTDSPIATYFVYDAIKSLVVFTSVNISDADSLDKLFGRGVSQLDVFR